MTMNEGAGFSGDEQFGRRGAGEDEADVEAMIDARVAAFHEEDQVSWSANAIERATQLVEALGEIPEIARQISSATLEDTAFRPTWLLDDDDPWLRRLVEEFAHATPATEPDESRRLAERMTRIMIRPAWNGILEATGSGQEGAEEIAWELLGRMDEAQEEITMALMTGDADRAAKAMAQVSREDRIATDYAQYGTVNPDR